MIAAAALIVSAVYVVISPNYYSTGLNRDNYREFFIQKAEPNVGIIKVWHIVKFKPFTGSLGTWLAKRADEYSGQFINLYFDVVSMTPDEAENELKRGESPDIISFARGMVSEELIKCIDGDECSLPYCASGYLLLYDPSALTDKTVKELIEKAGTEQDFKAGKAASCVCDIRAAGDLYRAQLAGKCPYFEAEPIKNAQNDLVQYVGLSSAIPEEKLKYAEGFMEFITGDSAQSKLSQIGLLPISRTAEAEYDIEWLGKLYDSFDPSIIQ